MFYMKKTGEGYLQSLKRYLLLVQLFMKKNTIHQFCKKWEENSTKCKLAKATRSFHRRNTKEALRSKNKNATNPVSCPWQRLMIIINLPLVALAVAEHWANQQNLEEIFSTKPGKTYKPTCFRGAFSGIPRKTLSLNGFTGVYWGGKNKRTIY